MRTRIISSVAGLGILAVVLVFFDTILLNIAIAFLCVVAVMELLGAIKLQKFRFLYVISILFALALVFQRRWPVNIHFGRICLVYVTLLFLYQLKKHKDLPIEKTCFAFCMTILVTMSFYSVVLIKDVAGAQLGVFYLFLSLGSAWLADTGAYFVGTFFGKHKLCPEISPKKTVEGLIGGICTAVLGNLAICLIFRWVSGMAPFAYFLYPVEINIPVTLCLTPLLSIFGVLGDLSASVIKRQHNVKDFGNIMPGHGGVMDRFDSVLFIVPAVYMIFNIFPLVSFIK